MGRNKLRLTLATITMAVMLMTSCAKSATAPAVTSTSQRTTTSTSTTMTTVASASVTGTVTYLEKIALLPGAVINVRLQGRPAPGAAPDIIGEQSITTSGRQVPIPFEITYNPAVIDPGRIYTVGASITVGGQLMFASDKDYPVITRGNLSAADIIVKRTVAPTTTSALALENTDWVLKSYGRPGSPKSVLTGSEITATFDPSQGNVAGSAGINRYFGGYKLDGANSRFPDPSRPRKWAVLRH
jgi:putative lipoprotein